MRGVHGAAVKVHGSGERLGVGRGSGCVCARVQSVPRDGKAGKSADATAAARFASCAYAVRHSCSVAPHTSVGTGEAPWDWLWNPAP